MGKCACSVHTKPTPTNNGGRLNFTWYEGNYAKGPSIATEFRECYPMNCSNKPCYTKMCARARDAFCRQYGKHCPEFGRKVCAGECPSLKDTWRQTPAGKSTDHVTNTKDAQARLGVDADCVNYGGLGGFGEWWCIQGKSVTKGLQTGGVLAGDIGNQVGKWMPVILAGFAGLAIILVFKQF